jgi:apolipoprotein N-acyltransferase
VPQLGGAWGLEICKDMDFPALSREYGRDGATLLLVPAWDFRADGWLHGRMAVLRSVENGFGIARSARNGLLTINDSRGRILAEADSSSATFAMANVTLPTIRESTFYRRCGDWFAWLNLATLVSILLLSLRSSRQSSKQR